MQHQHIGEPASLHGSKQRLFRERCIAGIYDKKGIRMLLYGLKQEILIEDGARRIIGIAEPSKMRVES